MMFDSMFGDDKKKKRTLGIRDKEILYERAKKKCEACGKQIEFAEMQVGHKKAFSKGGSTSFRNLVSLCYKCNKLQGTDDWNVFLRKLGKKPAKKTSKKSTKSSPKKTSKKKPAKRKKKKDDSIFGDFF